MEKSIKNTGKRLYAIILILLTVSLTAVAQVTTSAVSGRVMAGNEEVIGATISAKYIPTGAVYRAVTNIDGLYAISGMRAGGPYELEVSYIGFQTRKLTDIQLALGQDAVIDVDLTENPLELQEVVVVSQGRSSMRTDRSGSVTSVNATEMSKIPTVSRSMNDIMKMTPTGTIGANGFAVGGGNFRQSYVTIDGAAFNNAFGIGSNLPVNGSPISLDALEQISVSTSPFDVRQSGFTGGAINAVTKSGTNAFKATAYMYTTNSHLRGNNVGDVELPPRISSHKTIYGATFGGPIVKDKLFFFVSGEFEDNVSPGPTWRARLNESEEWGLKSAVHRPTVSQMNAISDYLSKTYGYNPGDYQGYSSKAPTYKILARVDWNINDNNKLNVRFSQSKAKSDNTPSSSVSPLSASVLYPGDVNNGLMSGFGIASSAALYYQSQRYFKEYQFTSVAAEWNAKWGKVNNMLRATYSYQNEPRSYKGGTFPTVHIVEDGALFAAFGPDIYSAGNVAKVKTFVATDEVSFSAGIHKLTGGLQYETNEATNGFMQAGNGMYVYDSWNAFTSGQAPVAYAVSFAATGDGSQFMAKMKQNNFSAYIQDQINFSDRFRLTAGLRMEIPIYPELKNNYNVAFANMEFGGEKYTTDQLPKSAPTFSPRVGFNWDITGDQRFVLRGGTGYFVGRLPFVWLVSSVLNSNCGQITYGYQANYAPTAGEVAKFSPSVSGQLSQLNISQLVGATPAAPSSPTILDRDLRMNATWKTSLALDIQFPNDLKLTLEGLYNRDFNPAVVKNLNSYYDGSSTITIAPGDTREKHSLYGKVNPYYITNAGNKAYYLSLTATVQKQFHFGLNLSASYTYAKSRTYGDGIGDQVYNAYGSGRYSINAVNNNEMGYASYVSPHRVLISANYRKEYGKHFASTVGLVYDGMNAGYAGSYLYSRYSYTLSSYVVNPSDSRANSAAFSLMYIPESRAALDQWNFTDISESNGTVYSASQQRDDFWRYIQQDKYLRKHTGEYAGRGDVIMPWHHQLDLKFIQDFYIKSGSKRHTLQLGIDIENLPNLLNKHWGLYKQIETIYPLSYNTKSGAFNFPKSSQNVRVDTYNNYAALASTYRIQFSVRYLFD